MGKSITAITTHATDALAALPAQYADKDLLRAVVQTLGDRAQHVEDCLIDMLLERLPTNTSTAGAQLDTWGDLVGQARLGGDYPAGEADSVYRQKLLAAARANRSKGRGEDITEVLGLLIGTNLDVAFVKTTPPAAFSLLLIVNVALSAAEQAAVEEFVLRAKAAGVGYNIAWSDVACFGFAADTAGTGAPAWLGPWGSPFAYSIP